VAVAAHFAAIHHSIFLLAVSAQLEGPKQWDDQLEGLVAELLLEELEEQVEPEGPQGQQVGFPQFRSFLHFGYSTQLSSYRHLQDHSLR
jgi:hypothetical protein